MFSGRTFCTKINNLLSASWSVVLYKALLLDHSCFLSNFKDALNVLMTICEFVNGFTITICRIYSNFVHVELINVRHHK